MQEQIDDNKPIQQQQTKQNKTKQNKTKQNKTKQNKTKQNKTKQNKTKQNKKHETNKFVICKTSIQTKFKLVRTDGLILVRTYFFYYRYVQSSKNSSYKSGQVPVWGDYKE
jgi:hypothetical protein